MKMYLKLLRLSVLLFITTLLFSACQKNEDGNYFELSDNEYEMFYQETQCSDPWVDIAINDRKKQKVEILKEYLNLKRISFIDIAYEKAKTDEVITCTACTCFTGAVFYIKTEYNKDSIDKLINIGFKVR